MYEKIKSFLFTMINIENERVLFVYFLYLNVWMLTSCCQCESRDVDFINIVTVNK